MKLDGFKKSFNSLKRTILYVYKMDPKMAILNDLSFVARTALDMIAIGVGGKFIDATADLLMEGRLITPQEYIYTESFKWLALALTLWILIKILSELRNFLFFKLELIVEHQAKLDVMRKIASENMQEVEQRPFQELVTFVPGYSIDRIIETYKAFTEMMRHLITLASAGFILYQSMGFTVLFLALIAVTEPLVKFIDDRNIHHFRLSEVEGTKFINYLNRISLAIPNFPELRVNGIYKYIIRAFRKEDREFNDGLSETFRRFYVNATATSILGQVLKYGYIIYVLFVSIAKQFSIGQFKALYDYANKVYDSTYNTFRQFTIMLDKASYTEEFFAFLDYEGFGDLDEGKNKLGKGTPRMELANLDFMYQDDPDRKVLENVSIVIEPGEKVAFVGGDGSGKSSLVKTLCGLYEIKSGDYMLDEYSIRELRRGELKGKISVVFQNFVRYNISVKRNITISSETTRIDNDLYEKVKKITGVNRFMRKEGINDSQILGKYFKGGKEISPGHWQRLAIARMLYRNRQIFILDEPFTFLDGISQEKILKRTLKFAGKSRTVIYITQDTDNVDLFDKVYYLHGGKVLESGTFEQLMRKKGKFYEEAISNR